MPDFYFYSESEKTDRSICRNTPFGNERGILVNMLIINLFFSMAEKSVDKH